MRKNTYHARDGTRKKSRVILGMIGALTAVLIGMFPQQVVEASWADEHHNTAVALYGGVNISGGWYYDRSYGGSDFGQQNIHTERVDYWENWLLCGIATGGIGTYDKGWKYHYNTGLSVKDWNFNGNPITCNVYGDTVGLTPVFIAYGDQNQKTGYTTSYSSYGSTSSYYATVGGRSAYVTEVGNYCSNVGIGRSLTPNTNTLHFHDGTGSWKCALTATYDQANSGLLNRSYGTAGYSQVGWCTADDGQSNHTQIYNSIQDAQKAGYWSFDTVWNNDLINFVCAVRGTTSGAAVELYPVYVRNPYTVYFNGNGGSASVGSRPTLFGTGQWNTGAVGASRYNGNLGGYNYSLTGWKDSSGRWVYDVNGNAVPGAYWSNWGSSGVWQYAGNTTAYAQWSANTCNIIFNGNGATGGSTGTQSIFQNVWTKLNGNGYIRKGYDFAGWNTAANGSGTSYADGGNIYTGSNITLYAQWKPKTFKLASNVNSPSDSAATGGWDTFNTKHGDTSHPTLPTASCNGYSFLGWYTKPNGGEQIYDAKGNIVKNTSMTDGNGGYIFDGKSGDTVTLYAHWATFDIESANATLGYQSVPLSNGDTTVTATYAGQNVYTDTNNSPYGSNVNAVASTRTINGDKAPNIDKIWVTVSNTVNSSQAKDYVVYNNSGGVAKYDATSLLDTVRDFPDVMDLTYVVHVKNTYGLEKTKTVYTTREIELFTTVEKIDTDINNGSNNSFSAGTRGILHVYTTGWVDDFNFTFPDVMYKSWEYDRSLNYPMMDPGANDVLGFTDRDPNMSSYPIAAYPSAVKMITGTEGYTTYGSTGFIRCYDFYFWIPLSISNPDNPNAQIVDGDTTWIVTTTARKYYNNKPVYENGVVTGTTTHSVVAKTLTETVLGGDPVKVTDQFRTVIKKVN